MIGGQSACLVGADHTTAAKCLDRRQASDDGILRSHLSCPKSEACRDDSSQTFRNSSNAERNSDLKVVNSTFRPAPTMRRVIEVLNVYKPNQDTDACDDLGQLITKSVQLLFQWCRLRDLRGDVLVDVANCRRASCQYHYCRSVSSNNCRAREEHIDLILLDSCDILDHLCVLVDRLALTSENCLIDLKTIALDRGQSTISWYTVSDSHCHNVSWD